MAEYIKVISASGKVHKLRDGAVCRNCKCDLTIENWSSRVSMSITRHDARVCGHGNKKD